MPRSPLPRTAQRLTTLALSLSMMGACSLVPLRLDETAKAPMLDGFGASTLQPSQGNEAARRLFAQGMAQAYAFNEDEAIRAFKGALAQDPDCALCAWGVALQMGPNINNTQRGDLREAEQYVGYALQHSAGASARDRELIASLAIRYGHASQQAGVVPQDICRSPGAADAEPADPLDLAYADRMLQLTQRFPDDPDVLTLYAEAEMVATRGDWWDKASGKPYGRIGPLATQLEQGLLHHPEHVGLNHYMIHAVDAVPVARRAEAAADRLGALAPKSPHLLHMPSHTYANLGRYADATRVNQLAVAADVDMAQELQRQHFKDTKDWRRHDLHFQWYGALMEGRGELALSTARASAARATHDHEFSEYYRALPMLTLLHLRRWNEVLQEPMPSGERGVAKMLADMARGIALARTGQLDGANAALARLAPLSDKLIKERGKQDFMDKMIRSVAGTAQAQLRAEIALAGGHVDDALAQQAAAVAASKFADDMEPPMLAGSPRQRLGTLQMQSKRYAAAEQSFRDDLALRPANGWSLQGLNQALAAQGKRSEAQGVARDLARSWALADAGLHTPRDKE